MMNEKMLKDSPNKNNNRISDEFDDLNSTSNELYHSNTQSEHSAFDDIDDYVYKKPKKSRKRVKTSGSENLFEDVEDIPLVVSDRGVRKKHGNHHRRKRKKMKTWKKVLLSVGCVLLGLVLLFVGTVAVLYFNGSKELISNDYTILAPENVDVQNNGEYVVYNGVTYKYNENITSILLMGIDENELDGEKKIGQAGQSDVNILLTIDTSTGKMSLINISRDIMTDVTEYSVNGGYIGMATHQLCLAYSFGDGKETSCINQVNTVKRLFYNIPINSYFSLDLDGISAINDSVGGVDVVSPENIGDFKQGETYHLEGTQAEAFVRKRQHDTVDANTYRMARQQVYLQSFISQVLNQTKTDFSTPLNLFNVAGEYSCTNINASKVCYLAATAITNGSMSYDMLNVPGEAKQNGNYAEYYVDETKFYEMFLSVFYQPVE
ncbi:MAG: LCP family protein [Ruminococcus sp.]|nr:LCP family protein [Ruminococcus sp.]